jgi:hypothetical protein
MSFFSPYPIMVSPLSVARDIGRIGMGFDLFTNQTEASEGYDTFLSATATVGHDRDSPSRFKSPPVIDDDDDQRNSRHQSTQKRASRRSATNCYNIVLLLAGTSNQQ